MDVSNDWLFVLAWVGIWIVWLLGCYGLELRRSKALTEYYDKLPQVMKPLGVVKVKGYPVLGGNGMAFVIEVNGTDGTLKHFKSFAIGRDGIKAGKWYLLDDDSNFVQTERN